MANHKTGSFRVELVAVVDMAGLRSWCATDKAMPADPQAWDAWCLCRAIGLGFVSKWDSQVVSIDEVERGSQDARVSTGGAAPGS